MSLKKLSCFIVLLFAIYAPAFSQYNLKLTSEFQINSLSSVEIVDYDPVNKRYLGYENESKGFVVLILDDKGNILQKKNLMGQGPGQFNSSMNALGYSDKKDIWVITPNQLLTFDKNLNFKSAVKYVNSNTFFTYRLAESPIFFYKDKSKNELVFGTYPSNTARFTSVKDLRSQHLMELHDLSKNQNYFLAPIRNRPISKDLDNSIKSLYRPVFTQDKEKNKLYITASLDNEITIIDLLTGNSISKININHGDFGSFKKLPITNKTLPSYPPHTLASLNLKIIKLDGGLIILNYVKEIPYGTFEKKITEDPFYHHFKDPNYHRIIIFDEEKQLSKDLEIPHGQIKIAMPNNSILVKLINPDEEEDFVRYGVYQITK
ncbi:hypothetical protein [Belliella pelovolcani]|uniref:hypothetical protein n=1 Tax=Belliella pelovolcani TaxID=529505 RepID=UPI00391AC0C7